MTVLQSVYRWIDLNAFWLNSTVPIVLCMFFFLMLYLYVFTSARDVYKVAKQRVRDQIDLVLTRNKSGTFSYDAQKERLDRLGVTYRTGGRVTPIVYLSYKALVVCIGIIVILSGDLLLGLLIGIGGWIIPDLLSVSRNTKDNNEMLSSIMSMYNVILLQMTSGVSITRILLDTYQVVEHPRLKDALLTLTGDIVYMNDLNVAIVAFGNKFQNENIQEFVVLVQQLDQTGTAKEMLADITTHLNTLQGAYNAMKQRAAQRLGDIITVLLFIGIIAFIGYAAVEGLGDTGSLFSM